MGDSAEGQSVLSRLVLWQDTSLTYLYGKNFEVDSDEQQTVTFEHASGLSFGDTFLFVDFIDYRDWDGDDDGLYGEFSPRFSASKIGDVDASFGPIKDVLVATTYEFGKGDVESLLYGIGFDLDVPGFDFFQLNFYYRDPHRLFIGVEYDYWSNKYGIKDSSAFKTDQSACSFLLKYYL